MSRIYNAAYDFEEAERYAPWEPDGYISTRDEFITYLTTPKTCMKAYIGARIKEYFGQYLFANSTMAYVFERNKETHTDVLIEIIPKISKIPRCVYQDMLHYFQRKCPDEAICRIMYNLHTGTYTLEHPVTADATHTSVTNAHFEPVKTPFKQLVATFHSHNSMPAFFSATDNRAEAHEIGIFGVVGRLDTCEPEMQIRAVFEGSSIPLSAKFLFEQEVA